MSQERLGERIRRLRRLKKWSQGDLAARAGTKATFISKYETGVYEPKSILLGRIAEALGTTTDFLITGQDPGTSRDARLQSLLPILEQLPGELRDRLADLLESLVQAHHVFRLGRLGRRSERA